MHGALIFRPPHTRQTPRNAGFFLPGRGGKVLKARMVLRRQGMIEDDGMPPFRRAVHRM